MIKKIKIIYIFEKKDKEYFKQWLRKYNFSLREFSKILDVSPQFLSAIINGKKNVPEDLLKKLYGFNCYNDLFIK